MPRALKSTARLWLQSKSVKTKYRDRGTAHLPDGTTKQVSGYGATKTEATASLYVKIETLEMSQPQAETITLTQLFAEFLQHKRLVKGSKAKTIYGDAALFRTYLQGPLGDLTLAGLRLGDLQEVQRTLTGEGKWRTAELATIQLKSLLTYAAKRYRPDIEAGHLRLVSRDDLDMVKRPQGVTRQAGELWTPEQVSAFLTLAKSRYELQPTGVLYPAFYTVLGAGLRRGELIGLGRKALKTATVKGQPRPYLDITEQLVEYEGELHHETPKTAAGTRRVPISQALAETLTTHLARMDRLAEEQGRAPSSLMLPSLVGTPLTARTLY